MTATEHRLTADTQVILLLYGRFGRSRSGEVNPLSHAEYDHLAHWLNCHGMRPGELLDCKDLRLLESPDFPIDIPRLGLLLGRGAAMALAVEAWTNKGIWVLSRSDAEYPLRLKQQLGRMAPPILYGVGRQDLLSRGGLAVVGSRHIDDVALRFTREVSHTCALQRLPVISGGARGVDIEAMNAALDAGGAVVGVLADSLARMAVSGKYRRAIQAGHLCLISLVDPESGFSVGNAMSRNKCVYAIGEWGLVVSSSLGEGGTWHGAIEALKAGRAVFVRGTDQIPIGNTKLLELGARPFPTEPWDNLTEQLSLPDSNRRVTVAQVALFDEGLHPRREAVDGDHAPSRDDSSSEAAGTNGKIVGESGTERVRTTGGDAHQEPVRKSAFDVVLPLLLSYLGEPRDLRSLEGLLDVGQVQLRAWLTRAQGEGKVQTKNVKRRVLYVATSQGLDLSAL